MSSSAWALQCFYFARLMICFSDPPLGRADRVQQYRTKEDETMAMFRNLAASRGFGSQ